MSAANKVVELELENGSFRHFDTPDITAREILEQAHEHLLIQVENPFFGGPQDTEDNPEPEYLRAWIKEEWDQDQSNISGVDLIQVCSAGAMLLVKGLLDLQDVDDEAAAFSVWARYVKADPEFGSAVRLLHAQIREHYPAFHRHQAYDWWCALATKADPENEGMPIDLIGFDLAGKMLQFQSDVLFAVSVIVNWNDYEDREFAEVDNLFTQAIKAAIEEEAA